MLELNIILVSYAGLVEEARQAYLQLYCI